ncbi:metal ABC transporter solute-binding protein, Zn/Mn family [Pseudomonadota bacterium]|uniref:metal ABC transporter solute-binding protein, Zn/Mn family n=1 Tax=unclassified Shewanella TaxID=196818 RepID=UPI000C82FC19|nr:zinc ABC transporter substrate-binding protein [Shewanella sp. 10N.286.52.C2]PMG45256.1 zinc ABC transporter substrate-binding protein [Shewanella sp. 10N.286.52.B9]PMH88276.1 zinc ABC transporter substrate-binding protein [Shewanella sp. 10N.286.48.B5]PMH94571.1 zinc ABC transporter substrate-binding protein [Shewanella sp. 10N.286.48.A6]
MRINSKKLILAAGIFASLLTSSANAALNVFACEPEYGALAKALAPDAKVYSATSAQQDPHQVQARPSLIAKMRQADLVVCAGADLEIGWLPMLQMKASNNKVLSTDTGLFYAADHIETLDQLEQVDRSMGDVHAKGNPHLHFDPRKFLKVAQALSAKMIELDPNSSAEYQVALTEFTEQWQQAIPRWEAQAQSLKGKKVIAYHSSFRYLFNWLGMEQVADLEPKPGIPPSSSHLAKLVSRSQQGDVMAVIVASYQDERGAHWLGERTDLPVVILPMSVGGNSQSQDLISLYDSVLTLLTEAQ